MGRTARLWVILARKARAAVVFRRGPSKRVQLLRWTLDDDAFDEGQWLKGRIYERRCDLSPSGERLVYFAASHKPPHYSWTAISKPPWLTALALWPKGDGWGGGGVFTSERALELNHRAAEMKLADGFETPRSFRLSPFGSHPGWGEDNPIHHHLLVRDGWHCERWGRDKRHDLGAPVWIELDPPTIYEKARPRTPKIVIERRIIGIKERNGVWWMLEHRVVDWRRHRERDLGRTDWADWDVNGDVLFARSGRLYRCALDDSPDMWSTETELIDLRDHRFEPIEAPRAARRW